jgi:hypothetical protein
MALLSSCGTHREHTNNGNCSVSFPKPRLQRQKISQTKWMMKMHQKKNTTEDHTGNRNSDSSSMLERFWYYVRLEDAKNKAPFSLSPLKFSGHYMYHTVVTICTTRFNIHKFYVLPTHCICVFCMDLRTEIISQYNIN